jgi:hypothetical protein
MGDWRSSGNTFRQSNGKDMKFFLKALLVLFVAFTVWLGGGVSARAQVSFTVSPPAVSNTYTGTITLQISGLTSAGDTVVVQKFLDVNSNGVVDAGDFLVQQFNLTDGQPGMAIGPVTNINVPGDTDGAADGQIAARLNFQNGDFIQNVIGKYLFQLSSPAGHFAAKTASFSVTNFPWAQEITGAVVHGGTNMPNAMVLLFGPPRPGNHGPGNPQAGTMADNSGVYTIQVPPGTYVPLAFKSNYVANFSMSPVLTVNSSQTIVTNLTLTNATRSISGQAIDINSGDAIPGLFIGNGSDDGYIGAASTDTNGNFTERVTAGQWSIDGEPVGLMFHGYVGYDGKTNIDTTTGDVSGLILAVPKANALLYGTVKDNNGVPLPGIDVSAYDNYSIYAADGYSDANGHYVVGVLGLGGSDPWHAEVGNDNGPTNYLFSQSQNTNVNAGDAIHQNFIAVLATNRITGNVQHDGTNVVGVGVSAYANIDGRDYNAYVDTDDSGNYSLNVANSNVWSVSVSCQGGSDSLDNILGAGTYQCPNNQNVAITNSSGTANFTVEPMQPLQISTTSLPDGTVGVYYDQSLGATGGQTPYDWWLPGGTITLPPGMSGDMNFSSDGTDATISGTPGTAGTYHFWVEVADNASPQNTVSNMFSITIQPSASPLQITTMSLPTGTNTLFYSQTLQASGGQTPYSWSVADYSALPSNLALATNGVLSGTLSDTTGPHDFDVIVADAAANSSTQTLSLNIVNPPLPPLVITNVSLPNGNVGAAYSAQLGATGGQPPYYWSYASGSINLASVGLLLSSSGLISGTPTTNKTSIFKVQVTDSNVSDPPATKVLSITINPRPALDSAAKISGTQFQFLLNGASNQNYTLQMSTNLSSTNWTALFVTNNPAANSFLLTDPDATNQQRFYRVLIGP